MSGRIEQGVERRAVPLPATGAPPSSTAKENDETMNTTTLNDAERDIDIDLAAIAEWQPPDYKDVFLGREVKAVMVFPPRSQHVNIHMYCVHLFVCLDADPLPDFTNGSGSL